MSMTRKGNDFFYDSIKVNPSYLMVLKSMEYEAYRWQLRANGRSKNFNNPIGLTLSRDMASRSLERYFAAIEKLINLANPKKDGEIA